MIQETGSYFTNQNLLGGERQEPELPLSNIKANLKAFIHDFTKENIRTYEAQLSKHLEQRRRYLNINLSDLNSFNEQFYEKFMASPNECLPAMEEALSAYAAEREGAIIVDGEETNYPMWQIKLTTDQNPKKLRDIGNSLVGRIFVVQGIIVSCTKPYIKASTLVIQCRNCQHNKRIVLNPGDRPTIPRRCYADAKTCGMDPYVVLPTSDVIDEQRLKIQEFPEDTPTGQIPRTTSLVCNRYNIDECVPGDRVRVTGIMMVQDMRDQQLGFGYMFVTGFEKVTQRNSVQYTQQEEEMFKKIAKDNKIYTKLFQSIAPGIYGSEDVKKAIACMLFGGSRKRLPDGTHLRGDINLLLIGDPSTAKSQFLKFVEQTASITVYTSGKGSSAAGLTASISKDPSTGEFQIEGGALVLADGGIVCIDEFDKMEPADRVAIHQAMEQQTISVAKAGITTRLNSRTSVLAAANPIFGRYDSAKTISDQIELQSTILSRFDCIFVVRDLNTQENNERIATHILSLHQGRVGVHKQRDSEVPFQTLKKYINYARNKCFPKLSAEACEKLQNLYVSDRQKSKQQNISTTAKHSIPITVRQLEALIRLSQSLAKMRLRDEVTAQNVDEAHRLFEVSTLKAVEGKQMGIIITPALALEIQKIEGSIKRKICIGNQVSVSKLIEEMDTYNPQIVSAAIKNLISSGDFKSIKNAKSIVREK